MYQRAVCRGAKRKDSSPRVGTEAVERVSEREHSAAPSSGASTPRSYTNNNLTLDHLFFLTARSFGRLKPAVADAPLRNEEAGRPAASESKALDVSEDHIAPPVFGERCSRSHQAGRPARPCVAWFGVLPPRRDVVLADKGIIGAGWTRSRLFLSPI